MASNMHVFDASGDMTFILQSLVKESRKHSSILSYRSSSKKYAKMYMRVSSRKVMSASPVFKAMLRHSFMEGTTLRATGKVEVPLPDDDPLAFAVLMDVVHGTKSNRKESPEMTLTFLTQLAILVDKYRLQKAVASAAEEWVDSISAEMPQAFSQDLMQWLCIAWVFRRPLEFNVLTRIAERESDGLDLDTFSKALNQNLPIPQRVIETLLMRRNKAIRNSFDIISRCIDVLQVSTPRCTSSRHEPHRYTCNNVLLGSLLESSTKLGLWPPPDPPYTDLTFKFVVHEIMQIKVVSFCSKLGYTNQPSGSHGLKAEIGSDLAKVKTRFSGLNLKDFD